MKKLALQSLEFMKIYVGTHLGVHSLLHMFQISKSAYYYKSTNYPFVFNVQLIFLLLRLFANMQLCDKMRKWKHTLLPISNIFVIRSRYKKNKDDSFQSCRGVPAFHIGILRDKKMDDKLMYNPIMKNKITFFYD